MCSSWIKRIVHRFAAGIDAVYRLLQHKERQSNHIGIESSYRDETLDNPLGDFHIYITVWREECFYPYEEELKKKFPDSFCERTEDRIYLHLPVIKGNDHDFIANKLAEYYFYMKDLTDRIK